MKKLIIFVGLVFSMQAYGGIAYGKITDVTIRAHDSVMVIRAEFYSSTPSCVTWAHRMGMKYGTELSKALYAMFLASKASGQSVRIKGTGDCESSNSTGTGYEIIEQANFGEWAL